MGYDFASVTSLILIKVFKSSGKGSNEIYSYASALFSLVKILTMNPATKYCYVGDAILKLRLAASPVSEIQSFSNYK